MQKENLNDNSGQIVFASLFWMVSLGFFLQGATWIFGWQGPALLSACGVWIGFVAVTIRWFVVSVPEVTGLVTINWFTGTLSNYGPGFHIKYPWEQAKLGNYINMRLVTVQKTENYPSKDGPLITIKWSLQYRPRNEYLGRYISVDETTINNGLTDVGSSFLSASIAQKEALDVKKEQEKIEEELIGRYESANAGIKEEGERIKLEDYYGVNIVRVSIADVDYEQRFQEVRATEQVAKRVKEIARDLKTGPNGTVLDVKDKDAMNTSLILNKNVTKTVTEVEGEAGQAIAALVMAAAGASRR